MYSVYADNICIYDDTRSSDESLQLISPSLTLAENSSGSFSVTIPPTNIGYSSITRLKSTIIVTRYDEVLWEGRVINEEKDFWNNRKLTCEGVLSYLNDTNQPQKTYSNATITSLLTALLTIHNQKVAEDRKIYVGNITVTADPAEYTTNYETTVECINNFLLSNYGGILRTRKENGRIYLDYLDDYPTTADQTIKFGKNLLDFVQKFNADNFATVLLPLGAQADDGQYVTVAKVNGGSIYVQSSAVSTYGWIEKVVHFEKIATPTRLLSDAQNYLQNLQFDSVTIDVKAVDLSYLDVDYEALNLLDYVRVISEPHGMDRYFPITKIEIPLSEPENTKFTIGGTVSETFTGSHNSTVQYFNNIINGLPTESEILEKARQDATTIITSNTTGYITLKQGEDGAEELYISDTPDYTQATKLWRWNLGGLGYSNDGGLTYGLAMTMDGAIVADYIKSGTLDVGNLTVAGTMSANHISGGTINGNDVNVTNLNADNITGGNLAADYIVAGHLNLAGIDVQNLSGNDVHGGSISGNDVNLTNLDADNITTGTIDASQINVTNIDADNITSGSIDASQIAVTNLNANNITSGSIDASQIDVKNLNASKITSGSIDASRINVTNLNADNITSGTMSCNRLDGGTLRLYSDAQHQTQTVQLDSSGLILNPTNDSTAFVVLQTLTSRLRLMSGQVNIRTTNNGTDYIVDIGATGIVFSRSNDPQQSNTFGLVSNGLVISGVRHNIQHETSSLDSLADSVALMDGNAVRDAVLLGGGGGSGDISGSGTAGYIAKFTGTKEIGNLLAISSTGTRFLKENGTWADPTWPTWSGGTGIIVNNNTRVVTLATYGTAGTAGTSEATSGSSVSVPYVTMDAYGRVSSYGTHSHTITGFLKTAGGGTVTAGAGSDVPLTVKSNNSGSGAYIKFEDSTGAQLGYYGISTAHKPLFNYNGTNTEISLAGHTHNYATPAAITAGTAGQSTASSGSALQVPYVTVNTQGIVTGYGTHTHTVTGFLGGSYGSDTSKYLRNDGQWVEPAGSSYGGGTGITVVQSTRTITLTDILSAAGTIGTSSATSGSTLAVPYATVNKQGQITGYGTHTHTVTGFLSGSYGSGTLTFLRNDGTWAEPPSAQAAWKFKCGYATITTDWTTISFDETIGAFPHILTSYSRGLGNYDAGSFGSIKVKNVTSTGFSVTIGGSTPSSAIITWLVIYR